MIKQTITFITLCVALLFTGGSSLYANESTLGADQCDQSNTEQCWLIANELHQRSDYLNAVGYYRKLCDFKMAKGCQRLGWAYQRGAGVELDMLEAQKYNQIGCDLENAWACGNLGNMHENEQVEGASIKRANELYKMSCDLNNYVGCYNLGYNYLNGYQGTELNVSKGLAIFTRGCELGDKDQCDSLADHYRKEESYEQALVFYKKSCALNSGSGCNSVGIRYANGVGVKKDITVANQFYEKSCDLDFGAGCNNFGRAFMHWHEIDPTIKLNMPRGLELLELACTLEQPHGCSGAGSAYKDGNGTAVDYKQANQYFIRGCDELDNSAASSCYNIALQYEQGKGVIKNPKQAKYYYAKACELGDENSCK